MHRCTLLFCIKRDLQRNGPRSFPKRCYVSVACNGAPPIQLELMKHCVFSEDVSIQEYVCRGYCTPDHCTLCYDVQRSLERSKVWHGNLQQENGTIPWHFMCPLQISVNGLKKGIGYPSEQGVPKRAGDLHL